MSRLRRERVVLAAVLLLGPAVVAIGNTGGTAQAESDTTQADYARSLIEAAGKAAELRLVKELGHREAYRIKVAGGQTTIEADSPAGFVYGAQAVARGEVQAGGVQKPDFDIRGTTLWLGGAVQGNRIAPYFSGFNSDSLPWFFDRAFMTRYLEMLASARFNTLFLWASHPFPYLLDLPEYPGATKLRPEQLRENQQQFRWLVSECGRRNITVMLHFYNIHLPDGLREKFGAQASWGASAVKNPSPEIAKYYRYVLGRYFEEFDNVGLYICPGETLATSHQLEWFRDVIFKAAKDSGRSPLLIIRDWTMNMDFRKQIPALYENCYSELKHNDESFTSPVPDRRHEQWRDLLKGHVVNLHGPPMDLQPMRWASPAFIRETVANWRDMEFVKGAEIYALSCFDWPYTQDKLTAEQSGYREQVKGPKLLWIDRSGIYLDAFGRYLWKADRTPDGERSYWEKYLAGKFHSPEVGKCLYRWYLATGPISPGMQNLTAVKFGNFWATVMLQNQFVDQILQARKRIDDVPITLTQEAGRTRQVYYSQPVDEYFFRRYKDRYGLGELTERISMPVAQYAGELSAGRQVTKAMTPDKVCDLLCELADEGLESARAAWAAATDPDAKAEMDRFVTDSRMYVLVTRAFREKVSAAILKARMLSAASADLGGEFLKHMEQSVKVYEDLAKLTDQTYRNANDLMGRHWKREGLAEFRKDLADQQAWLAKFQEQSKTAGGAGAVHYQKANMPLCPEGKWAVGEDKWGRIVRVNMLKIEPADWAQVPGVKKAWPMKGFEGVAGMAFHPVISEVKDVDGDGKPDIFRCRSEHAGARIERLRYDDGSVVWESEPLGALHGDESRLPVFDLRGEGRFSVLHATKDGTWCISADTGKTQWSARDGCGDIVVGHFLDKKTQAVVVRDGGVLRCYDQAGRKVWTHDTKLTGGAAYSHEMGRCDVDGDGLDEIFANWQKLTMGLRGDGRVLWEDRTQRHHSDFIDYGDVDGDGKVEVVYDHEGCDAAKGPIQVVDPLTGQIKVRIDYRAQGVRHAQNVALGDFDRTRKGLEIAFCEKSGNIYLFDAAGRLLWKRPVPASLLSKGDWDGDGDDEVFVFGLGANVDGMFSVWDGDGTRLYAISFLPSPYNRFAEDTRDGQYKKNFGGSWRAHAMPGGHEGLRRQVDLDGNGRADVIMPFGEWHWGSDSILFLMECGGGR